MQNCFELNVHGRKEMKKQMKKSNVKTNKKNTARIDTSRYILYFVKVVPYNKS